MNFTHFFRPEWDMNENQLKGMWKRRVAYYAPGGLFGLDLLIVIKKANKPEFALLRVQVQNWNIKVTR